MTRMLVYFAHPLAGDAAGNVLRARGWLRWLMASEPEFAIAAPWLAAIDAGADDHDVRQRARGLRDAVAFAERCDGIVLVGGRVTRGMTEELDAVTRVGGWTADLTRFGVVAPDELVRGVIASNVRPRSTASGVAPIDMLDWLNRDAVRRRLGR